MHFKSQFATALGYGERFVKAIKTITAYPSKGAVRPSLGGEAHVVLVYPYLLIYDFNESADTATLLRVLHGKRNIAQQLIKRPGRQASQPLPYRQQRPYSAHVRYAVSNTSDRATPMKTPIYGL